MDDDQRHRPEATGERSPVEPAGRGDGAGREERRRRLAALLDGDLPAGTRDEAPEGWGDRPDDEDDWLRRQVPPHHG